MSRRWWRSIPVLVGAVVLAGCTGATSAGPTVPSSVPSSAAQSSASGAGVRITVDPASAPADTPFRTTVTGLPAGSTVTLRLTGTDRSGRVWSASADFRSGATGTMDTSTDAAVGGAFTGVEPMGLTDHLATTQPAAFLAPDRWTMTESVLVGGATAASATLTRQRPEDLGVRTTDVRPAADGGLYGELYQPADTSHPRAGVVVFGGSEGGLSVGTQAKMLAAHGFSVLAYFAEPGLPAQLERIPLDYFDRAARYLAGRPGVDSVVLWGDSRGSEAALLTAANFPGDVGAVVATVPGAQALGGLPDATGPAWTLRGSPVPTAPPSDDAAQAADRPSTIPVERITGPVLLVCGGADQVWRSCANSDVITRRATEAGRPAPTLLRYPQAGHFVGLMLPYDPFTVTDGRTAAGATIRAGGTPAADAAARADAWPKLLAFLAAA
jgi:dienelactone hydrolase